MPPPPQCPQPIEVALRPERPAVQGEGVEEGVAGGVVALPGDAERPGEGGEEHEELDVADEFVQVDGRVDLDPQDAVDLVEGELVDDGVVEDRGGVHDAGHRMLGQQRGELVAVGDVAGHHGRAEFLRQFRRPPARRARNG